MVAREPIVCPSCGEIVVQDKNTLTFLVLYSDIMCPNCGTVVVHANNIAY